MSRLVSVSLLAAAIGLSAGAVASAQVAVASAQVIERSGNIFHVAICGAAVPGVARCHAHAVTDERGNHITRNATKNTTPSGYSPSQLRSAYNITATGSQSTIVAIVDAYGYTNAETDLGVYRAQFGLPACTTANGCFGKYNESGTKTSYPNQNTGWAQELALDLDMVSAMCPNCKIILVEASSASYADLAAAENTAARLGAKVIDNSYGGAENGSQPYASAYQHPGVAITASSGDSGYAAGPQFPATSPYVIAVGGTSLYTASGARGWSEVAWSDAGSGCSKIYPKPAWQKDPLCTMRMEADVSAVADPYTGVATYAPVNGATSAWQVFGGTSVSAQVIGGIYGASGVFPANYGSTLYSNTNALYDVTSGSNGRCSGTYFCTAGVGYDGPTGLGTPHGISAF